MTIIPHKILCIRWIDFIVEEYNSLLTDLSDDEVIITPQLIGGVALKKKVIVQSDKPNVKDFKDFQEYFIAFNQWKKTNEK